MSLKDISTTAELTPAHAVSVLAPVVVDGRRRPGRLGQVSLHLVPLLRDPAGAVFPAPVPGTAEPGIVDDRLSAARGIGVALVLGVPVWAVIGLVTWALLR